MFGNNVTNLWITDGSEKKSNGELESILNQIIMKRKYLEFMDVTKAVLMGKFVAFKAYIRKEWSLNWWHQLLF